MTADRTLGSTLGALALADVAAIMAGELSIPITINGAATRGIVREYVGQVDDPRKPEVYVKTADLPVNQHGDSVVIGAESFALGGVQPVAPGLVRLVLT